MRTRFLKKRIRRMGYAVSLLMTALMFIWLIIGTMNVSSSVSARQLTQLNRTVRRYAVQCYALEGRYPESLEYLEQQYGLTLDRSLYVYHYRFLGANIFPEIAVFALSSKQ